MKMARRLVAALLLQVGATSPASAQEVPSKHDVFTHGAQWHRVPVLGVGNETCREWTYHHAKRDAESHKQDQWLGGFASAYNLLIKPMDRGPNFFETEMATIPSAISHYCAMQAQDSIAQAAIGFLETRRKVRR